jgi:hypothetical protein
MYYHMLYILVSGIWEFRHGVLDVHGTSSDSGRFDMFCSSAVTLSKAIVNRGWHV